MRVRLPRMRVTVRGVMVAVAIVATILAIGAGLQRRRERFERLSIYHRRLAGPMLGRSFTPPTQLYAIPNARWHYELSLKYAEAARFPWLPVEPDPPPPPVLNIRWGAGPSSAGR